MLYDITIYRILKIQQTSEYNKKAESDIENKLVVASREREAERGN